MNKIGGILIGEPGKFTFEERIFNFAVLLGIILTVFGTVMDMYYKVSILVDLIFVGCWILSYYLSKFRGFFSVVSVISMGIFIFGFIPYIWIASGGSSSIIPYYNIVFVAIICIVLNGKFRTFMVASVFVVELLLVGRDISLAGSLSAALVRSMNMTDFSIHICVIMTATAILIIVYSNTYMREKARSDEYSRIIEEQYRQQLYYMENLEQVIHKLKSERHDFNNHLGVIYGLLEAGETDKAQNYTKQLVKTAEEYQNIVNIPYSMVRAMLNYKLSAAMESGIELRLDISVPAGLTLNEFDFAVILGNLLDNAMEACAAMDESSGYIGLSILYKPDYLIIQVENPVNIESVPKDERNRTTKSDSENHGFGLSNIEYLVNKHNGLMKIGPENGVFKVSIALLFDSVVSG